MKHDTTWSIFPTTVASAAGGVAPLDATKITFERLRRSLV
jgi:hypothetical protein